MTPYERIVANATHFHAEQRMGDAWWMGGILYLKSREQRYRHAQRFDTKPTVGAEHDGACAPLFYLPEIDPVTMKSTGRYKTARLA